MAGGPVELLEPEPADHRPPRGGRRLLLPLAIAAAMAAVVVVAVLVGRTDAADPTPHPSATGAPLTGPDLVEARQALLPDPTPPGESTTLLRLAGVGRATLSFHPLVAPTNAAGRTVRLTYGFSCGDPRPGAPSSYALADNVDARLGAGGCASIAGGVRGDRVDTVTPLDPVDRFRLQVVVDDDVVWRVTVTSAVVA